MASSSSKQTSGSSSSNLQIKPKTMAIPSESFEVQSESPVGFASLRRNKTLIECSHIQRQGTKYKKVKGSTK